MRRAFRIVARVLVRLVAILVSLLALLALALALLVDTDYGQRKLRTFVHDTLRDRYGLELTLGSVDLSLLPTRVVVRAIALEGSDEEPLVTAAGLRVSLDAGALLRGDLVVDEIAVERPRVRLVLGPDGAISNLPHLRPQPGGQGGTEVWVRAVRITGGELHLEAPALAGGPAVPLVVDLGGLALRVTGPERGSYDLALEARSGAVAAGERRFALEELSAEARLRPGQLFLDELGLGLGALTVHAQDGELGLSPPYDAAVELQAALPLAMLAELSLGTPPLAGELSLSARLGRRGGDPWAQGRVSVGGLAVGVTASGPGGPLGDLEAEVRYGQGLLAVPDATIALAQGGGGRVVVQGASLGLAEDRLPLAGRVALERVGLGQVLAALGVAGVGVELGASGELAVAGSLRPLALQVDVRPVEVRDLRLGSGVAARSGPRLVRLQGQVSVGASAASSDGLAIALGQEQAALAEALRVWGTFPFSAAAPLVAGVRSAGGGLQLGELAGLAGVSLSGVAGLEAQVSGTYSEPVAEGQVSVSGLRVAGRAIDAADASFRYEGGVLSVPVLHARAGQSRVTARDGVVALGGAGAGLEARAVVALEPVALEEAVVLAGAQDRLGPLHGLLEGQAVVQLRRDLAGLSVALTGVVPEVGWDQKRLGEATLDLGYDGGVVAVRRFDLRRGSGLLELCGSVGTGGALDLALRVTGYRLPPLEGVLPESIRVRATIDATARITGTTAAPLGSGELALRDTELSGQPLEPSAITFELSGDELRLEGQVAGDTLRLDEARLELVAPRAFSVRGSLGVEDAAAVVPPQLWPSGVSDAQLAGAFEVAGELDDTSTLAGTVTLDELGLEAEGVRALAAQPLELQLANGEVVASEALIAFSAVAGARPGLPGATVRLAGLRLGLASPWPLRARAVVRLRDLGQLLGPNRAPEGLSVSAEVDLGVVGDLGDLADLRGQAMVRGLEARQGELELRTAAPLVAAFTLEEVRLQPARLLVSSPALSGPRELTLGGWLSRTAMDFELDGSLELGMVRSLVRPVEELSGLVTVTARVTGSPESPQILGEAELTAARAVIAGLPGAIEHANGAVRFSSGAILVDWLEAGVLGGEASVNGRVELAGLGLGILHLDAVLRDATYPIGPRSSASFNAKLAVDRAGQAKTLPLVSGRVDVVNLLYREPVDLGLDVDSMVREVLHRSGAKAYDPEDANVRLDVKVAAAGPLRVQNDLIDGTLHIDGGALEVVGTDLSPALLGTVRIEEGSTVTFRNNRFEVLRGLIRFTSSQDIDGNIDFEATTERRDWQITLRATGSLSDPRIQLSSEPPLSEVDILLVLAAGMTQAEFRQLGATSILTDVLAEGVSGELERLFPFLGRVAEIQVLTEYSPRLGTTVPVVHIGRNLTPHLELGATVGLSTTHEYAATLRYKLSRGFSVEVDYSSAQEAAFGFGNVGAELHFSREFGGPGSRTR